VKVSPLSTALLLTTFLVVASPADDNVGSGESAKIAERIGDFDFSSEPVLPTQDLPSDKSIRTAIERGIQFLVQDQNKNGSWGSPTRTKGLNIFAPVPGAHDAFRTATTSLCISALIETKTNDPDALAALQRGEDWLIEKLPDLRRATGDAIYNVWGHAYAISALVQMLPRHEDDKEQTKRIVKLIESQFDMLERYESVDGGWGYYDFRYQAQQPTSDSISFVNGACLVALAEAKAASIEPPSRLVKRAIAATKRQQKPDFSYLYGEYLRYRPMREINRPGGSLGRSQCCNAALRMWDDKQITDQVLKHWLAHLYSRNGWLDIGRKRPVPHESWMQVAGYFYYFGHFYAARCVDLLPEAERDLYQSNLAKLILEKQEKDGSWWDYPLYDYHQPYGTGFALMTLVRTLPE